MKKIICLLLALTCVFALFSCDDEKLEKFIILTNKHAPTKIITQTSYNDGEQVLRGRFETALNGEDFEMIYEYSRYATPEEGVAANDPDGYIKTEKGTVYYKNGSYSTDGESWFVEIPDAAAMQVKLSIGQNSFDEYKISKDGKTLTAKASSEKAEKIFGINVDAVEAVDIVITNDGTYLRSISITYATENAESVTIETTYSYEPPVNPEPNPDPAPVE
jgi:hypothetical protein